MSPKGNGMVGLPLCQRLPTGHLLVRLLGGRRKLFDGEQRELPNLNPTAQPLYQTSGHSPSSTTSCAFSTLRRPSSIEGSSNRAEPATTTSEYTTPPAE